MSLITRCPACNTMFKVVADQLRISEGWVRCGQCNEIFDASAQLQEAAPPPKPKSRKSSRPHVEEEAARSETELTPVAEPGVASTSVAPALMDSPDTETGDGFPPTESLNTASENPPPVSTEVLQNEPMPEPSFMREGKPVSRWQRPVVRFALGLLSLGLLTTLMLQWVIQERDRLVAMEPSLSPWVQEVCAYAECTVAPLRQIDAIVIDSSAFNRVRGDVYRLNFTLKNTSWLALAQPAIELSVTDVHDQPILRRVFSPAEIGTRSGVLPASSESSSSLTLSIKTGNSSERIAGYRILAFYP